MRLQSATEYISTYIWGFLVAAIAIAALYLYLSVPSSITPSSCSFSSGPYCQDLVLGSNAMLSKMAIFLTNTQEYPIINPSLQIKMAGFAPATGTCVPNVILPGGAIVCNVTIGSAISKSASVSGRTVFSYTSCPGGNSTYCQDNPRQSFPGSFSTRASGLLLTPTVTLTLTVQNSTEGIGSGPLDKVIATVRLLGLPLAGATVNFAANSLGAVLSSPVSTTDANGNVYFYISSSQLGFTAVSVIFANSIANKTILFVTYVYCNVPDKGGANLAGASLRYCQLMYYQLAGDNFQSADLTGSNMYGADANGSNFQGATLAWVNLQLANLSLANFHGASLANSSMEGAILSGANLQGANLAYANLQGANLKGANLQSSNLVGASLQGANLAGANLQSANASSADFQDANLTGANMLGAKTAGANFAGAITKGCNGCP
ncbi:MAG: pentapeptide repeat-containing protein [Candidatus Micrarchaeota archaeon]|nr:pentapeptide repeat-containing protein [Candidatus Micrarchaeota archaeon]